MVKNLIPRRTLRPLAKSPPTQPKHNARLLYRHLLRHAPYPIVCRAQVNPEHLTGTLFSLEHSFGIAFSAVIGYTMSL